MLEHHGKRDEIKGIEGGKTRKCVRDIEALKKQLAEPPILAAPIDKEPLLLYVAANSRAISVAIVVERKESGKEYPVQRTVYYVSEVLKK